MDREKRVANYFLLAFGLISIALMSLPLTGKVQAFRAYAAYLYDPLPYYGFQGLQRIRQLPPDVVRLITADAYSRELEAELKQTALLRAEAEGLRRENERLAASLSLSTSAPKALRWARVIEREPQNWHRALMIDAGAEDGLEVGSPVLAAEDGRLAVAGRIVETSRRTSKVLLLSDELSAVAAYFPEGQWEGLVQGQGSVRLKMNYLPVEAQVRIGDKVATSPTSATFPPDILIGMVSKVFERDPFLAFQVVEVSPAVHPGRLKEVLILRRKRKEAP
ncbi:MAG TPA: rod shape-determining protein MreC [Elusimicrobia bacterium]|nr:rod shape-determining protein MreC [Elusimicrobiota bacterium]